MFRASLLAVSLASTALVLACSAQDADGTDSSEGAVGKGGARPKDLTLPKPGSEGNRMNVDAVVDAWSKVRKEFYESDRGYKAFVTKYRPNAPAPAGLASLPPPTSETTQCLDACPSNWSDIVCHYYAWMPSYARVVPNVRGCFSYVTYGTGGIWRNDLSTARKPTYPEAYDYCVYNDYDMVGVQTGPQYTVAGVAAQKAAGKKSGVLAWIDDDKDQRDVFKYLMFTWYNPFTYDVADQQDAINAFYGVKLSNKSYTAKDKADVAACNAKRPVRQTDDGDGTHCSAKKDTSGWTHHGESDTFVAYMEEYIKNGGVVK